MLLIKKKQCELSCRGARQEELSGEVFTHFQLSEYVPKENFYRRLKSRLNLDYLYKVTKGYYGDCGQKRLKFSKPKIETGQAVGEVLANLKTVSYYLIAYILSPQNIRQTCSR